MYFSATKYSYYKIHIFQRFGLHPSCTRLLLRPISGKRDRGLTLLGLTLTNVKKMFIYGGGDKHRQGGTDVDNKKFHITLVPYDLASPHPPTPTSPYPEGAPSTFVPPVSTDEYQILILVHEQGQIPKSYSYLLSETNTSSYDICLHLV